MPPPIEIRGGSAREIAIVRKVERLFPEHTVAYVEFSLQPFIDFQVQSKGFYHSQQRWMAFQPGVLTGPSRILDVAHEFVHDADADEVIADRFTQAELKAASYYNPCCWDGWRDEKEGAAVIGAETLIYPSRRARIDAATLGTFLTIWRERTGDPFPQTADWGHPVGTPGGGPVAHQVEVFPQEFNPHPFAEPFNDTVKRAGWERALLWSGSAGRWQMGWEYDRLDDDGWLRANGIFAVRAERGDWIWRHHHPAVAALMGG